VSDRARIRSYARRVSGPTRDGRRRPHRRVRAPRARVVDVPDARRLRDGLLGCQPKEVDPRCQLQGRHTAGPATRTRPGCGGPLDRARARAGGRVVSKTRTIMTALAAVAVLIGPQAPIHAQPKTLKELSDGIGKIREADQRKSAQNAADFASWSEA